MHNLKNPVILVTIITAIGVYLRFAGLGTWDFAIDEYYFAKSVLSISENGVPNFPNGGYYTRGLLIQYLTVPFVFLFNNLEYAVRFIPALLNVLSIPAVYYISKYIGGSKAAVLAVLIFTISLWEIEFARFARMYAPFQFIFIWQIYFLIRYLTGGKNKDINIVLILAVISTFIYAGSIFLVFVALYGLIYRPPEKKYLYFISTFLVLIGTVVYNKIDFRNASPLPIDSDTVVELGIQAPLYFPKFLFFDFDVGLLSIVVFISTLVSTTFIIIRFEKKLLLREKDKITLLFLLIFTVALLLNQLLLAILVIPVILFSEKFGEGERFILINFKLYFSLLIFWFLAWAFIGLIQLDLNLNNFIEYVFDYPRIKTVIIWHWIKAIPIHTTLILSVLFTYFFILAKNANNHGVSIEGRVYSLLILLVMILSILKTQYHTTRYSFFIYPLVICVFSIALIKLDNEITHKFLKNKFLFIFLIMFFSFSEVYKLDHLLNISDAKYNYRVNYDQYRSDLYFLRQDFRSTAEYVNKNRELGDTVITLMPGVDFYLQNPVDMMFMREGRYVGVLSCNGDCFIWNGAPVIFKKNELLKKIENSNNNLWVIANYERYFPLSEIEKYLLEHHEDKIKYYNFDKSLVVYGF